MAVNTMLMLKQLFLLILMVLVVRIDGTQNCTLEKLDLVFVVDESRSIGLDTYKISSQAAIELVNSLNIGPYESNSQVGFVLFNNYARLGFNLDDYSSKNQIIGAIRNLSYTGSGTNIAAGMDFAIRNVFMKKARPETLKVIILITDGQDTTEVEAEQLLAAENNINVFAIGVTDDVDNDELYRCTGDIRRVHHIRNSSDIPFQMESICNEIAQPFSTPPPQPLSTARSCGCDNFETLNHLSYWLDVIFVVDISQLMTDEEFSKIKDLLVTVGTLNIRKTYNDFQYSRYGIVTFNQNAEVFLGLNRSLSAEDYINYINTNLKKSGSVSYVSKGLPLVQKMLEEEEVAQRRANVPKVVILITTQNLQCNQYSTYDYCKAVLELRRNKVTLISLGIKNRLYMAYPNINITYPCQTLNMDQNAIQKVEQLFCMANCFCPESLTQFTLGDGECSKYAECYRVNSFSIPFEDAQVTCEDLHGTLPQINSIEKNNFIQEIHSTSGFYPYWVGQKCYSMDECVLSGNTTLKSSYQNWCTEKNQPKFTNGNCVYEDHCTGLQTKWFTGACDDITTDYFFACQFDACSVSNYCDEKRVKRLTLP